MAGPRKKNLDDLCVLPIGIDNLLRPKLADIPSGTGRKGSGTAMNWIEFVPDYITAIAIVVGGAWAYARYFHERSDEPATDIDVDVSFIGVHHDACLIEVDVTLENKSLVRHYYHDFRMDMRYLLPSDPVVDGDVRLAYQVCFPHSIDARLGEGVKRYFPNAEYINPRQTFHQRYVTFVPTNALFIRVHCVFTLDETLALRVRQTLTRRKGYQAKMREQNNGKHQEVKIDTQRVFAVECSNMDSVSPTDCSDPHQLAPATALSDETGINGPSSEVANPADR